MIPRFKNYVGGRRNCARTSTFASESKFSGPDKSRKVSGLISFLAPHLPSFRPDVSGGGRLQSSTFMWRSPGSNGRPEGSSGFPSCSVPLEMSSPLGLHVPGNKGSPADARPCPVTGSLSRHGFVRPLFVFLTSLCAPRRQRPHPGSVPGTKRASNK